MLLTVAYDLLFLSSNEQVAPDYRIWKGFKVGPEPRQAVSGPPGP